MRNAYKIITRKPEAKGQLGRARHGTKVDSATNESSGAGVEPFDFTKNMKCVGQVGNCQLLKEGYAPWC